MRKPECRRQSREGLPGTGLGSKLDAKVRGSIKQVYVEGADASLQLAGHFGVAEYVSLTPRYLKLSVVSLLGVLALTATVLLAMTPPASAGEVTDVRVTRGIVYGQGAVNEPAPANVDLPLDLYEPLPRTNQLRPAVVLIHGGGFRRGSRRGSLMVSIAKGLAERGIVAVSIDYRLTPQSPVPSARVDPVVAVASPGTRGADGIAAIDDTLTALDWLKDHAGELHVDPDRLGLAGGSAGAITSAHVAYVLDDLGVEAPRIRFVGDLWGGILIWPNSDLNGAWNQLDSGEAALFAVHGTADTTVPVYLSDSLVARATAVGVPVEYHRFEGATHGSVSGEFLNTEVAPGQTAYDRMLDFAEAAFDTAVYGSATAGKTRRQRGKRVVVPIKVTAEQDLGARARGTIRLKGKAYALKPRTVDVAAGEKKTLKLKPKKRKHAKKSARVLKKGKKRRGKAKLTVKLTDGAGDKVSEKLKVKLKR